MKLTTQEVGDVTVVVLPDADLDARSAPDFKREAAAIGIPKKVVLDMSHVGFVDSTGLGAILSYMRAVESAGGKLKLCGNTHRVKVFFDLVRMHRIVDIFENEVEAIRAFSMK